MIRLDGGRESWRVFWAGEHKRRKLRSRSKRRARGSVGRVTQILMPTKDPCLGDGKNEVRGVR